MVNRKGQAITEFTLILGLLTILGIFLMDTWIGPSQNGGVSAKIVTNYRDSSIPQETP